MGIVTLGFFISEISVCIDYIYSCLYLSYFGKCIKPCLFVCLITNAIPSDFMVFLCSWKKIEMATDRLLFLKITLIIICNIYQLEIYYHSSVF